MDEVTLYSLASETGNGNFILFNSDQKRILCRNCGWNQMVVTGKARAESVVGGPYVPIRDLVYVFQGQMLARIDIAEEMQHTFTNIALGEVQCNRLLLGRGTHNQDMRHVYTLQCYDLKLGALPDQYTVQCEHCGRTYYRIEDARKDGVDLQVLCQDDVGLARVCQTYPQLLGTRSLRDFFESRGIGKYLLWRQYGHVAKL